MTDEGAKKKYKHLKNIIAGKYSTERYLKDDLNEENNLNAISNELMISDATLNLADLIKKRPNIDFDGSGSVNQKIAKVEAEIKAKAETKAKKEAETKAKKEAEAK